MDYQSQCRSSTSKITIHTLTGVPQVSGSEAESWTNSIEASEVIHAMQNTGGTPWAPIFQDLVRCSPPKTIINFDLWWRDPQPTWLSPGARIVQIGDCAHSFLPSSGSGATQAIEDAVSLASCLQIAGRENVTEAVRVHQRLRYVFSCIFCSLASLTHNDEALSEHPVRRRLASRMPSSYKRRTGMR